MPVAPPAGQLDTLLAALSAAEPSERRSAAWDLAGANERVAEVRAALQPLRTDPVRDVRYAAEWALGHVPERGAGPGDASAVETPPRPVRITRPTYPKAAFDQRVQGEVVVELLIGEEGEVFHAEVRKSIPGLDAAALECVRQWRFEPGRIDGVPRATVANAPVRFRIF